MRDDMMADTPGAERKRDERLIRLVEETNRNVATMSVKLFGTDDANHEEQKSGRLPRVEAKAAQAHMRIDRLTSRIDRWIGAIGAAFFIFEFFKAPLMKYFFSK